MVALKPSNIIIAVSTTDTMTQQRPLAQGNRYITQEAILNRASHVPLVIFQSTGAVCSGVPSDCPSTFSGSCGGWPILHAHVHTSQPIVLCLLSPCHYIILPFTVFPIPCSLSHRLSRYCSRQTLPAELSVHSALFPTPKLKSLGLKDTVVPCTS